MQQNLPDKVLPKLELRTIEDAEKLAIKITEDQKRLDEFLVSNNIHINSESDVIDALLKKTLEEEDPEIQKGFINTVQVLKNDIKEHEVHKLELKKTNLELDLIKQQSQLEIKNISEKAEMDLLRSKRKDIRRNIFEFGSFIVTLSIVIIGALLIINTQNKNIGTFLVAFSLAIMGLFFANHIELDFKNLRILTKSKQDETK